MSTLTYAADAYADANDDHGFGVSILFSSFPCI